MMKRYDIQSLLRALCGAVACLIIASGCRSNHASGPEGSATLGPDRQIDMQRIQSQTMGFADLYVTQMADAYDQARRNAKSPEARIMALRLKVFAGMGATANAVNPNPIVGLMDMALMVTLNRLVMEEPWATELFGAADVKLIVAVLKAEETAIWTFATTCLTPGQITELKQLASRWHREHPDQRYVQTARLADFPESKPSNGAQQLASSVFGLIHLNPFSGLDPAVQQVEESRILAERMFYYLRHMPLMLSWQVDSLYDQMLAQPQMTQLFENTTTVAGSTTRFSQATSQFSDASTRLAGTVEKFRLQLPDQQARLVSQLDELIARQRDAALRQATTQVATQRDVTIRQINSTIATQQDLMARNLQTVTDQSIDRLYQRVRALVLIAVVAVLGAFLIYHALITRAARRQERARARPLTQEADHVL